LFKDTLTVTSLRSYVTEDRKECEDPLKSASNDSIYLKIRVGYVNQQTCN